MDGQRYDVRIEGENGGKTHSFLTFVQAVNIVTREMTTGKVITVSPVKEVRFVVGRAPVPGLGAFLRDNLAGIRGVE